jgi:hypothetical protein
VQTVRDDINILRTGLNSITQDMKKLSKLMVAMHLHMQNLIKYGPRAGMESEYKLTEAVACLSDAELHDNEYR